MYFPCKVLRTRNLLVALSLSFIVLSLTVFRLHLTKKQFDFFADSIWSNVQTPVLTMRHNLTFPPNMSNGVIPQGADAPTAEDLFHRYASELQVICPVSERFGNKGDGGWDLCVYSAYRPRQRCLIYSFGINNDWSFDDSVVSKFNCTLRAFDPSMLASDHRRGSNIWFYKKGISGSDVVDNRGWQLRTLESLNTWLNESNEIIDYLKMDVEYSEWSSLEAILNSTILSRVKQFGLETHTREVMMRKSSTVEDFVYYTGLLHRLQEEGFYRWYWHYNNFGVFVSANSHRKLTCCYEMVFVNVNVPYVV